MQKGIIEDSGIIYQRAGVIVCGSTRSRFLM